MFGLVAEELHVVMAEVRERTFALVAHLDEAQLNSTLNPIMSPLSWDLGHMAAYEDLWLNHRAAGRDLLREDLAALYDAFETPRAVRGDLEFLRGEELLAYMAEVRARALEAPVGELHELVIRHELQHTETMLQAMAIAGITPPSFSRTGQRGRLRAGDDRGRRRARSSSARTPRASPTTTSARATPPPPAATRSAARRSRTRPGRRGPRRVRARASWSEPAGRGAPSTASTPTPAERPTRPSCT